MSPSWPDTRTAFADAAAWFVATTALVGDRWSEPGLGEWDVRSLVGHTSRSLLTVEAYLAQPAPAAEISSPDGYVRATRAIAAGPAVAVRGREAGAALGADPAAAVAEIAARVLPLVGSCDGTELVTTIAGGMRLSDYLPTRTFELAVHTTDLATALGVQEAEVTRALTAFRAAQRKELEALKDRLVGQLATELGVSEAKVAEVAERLLPRLGRHRP